MIEPSPARDIPPKKMRDMILNLQEHKCFYCDLKFGSTVYRKSRSITLRLNWDHKVPFAYQQNNNTSNFVAACHVCNGVKSSHVFQTVEQAQVFILGRREEKGYSIVRPVQIELQPETRVAEIL